jgi:hypothetical protein
MIRNGSNTDDTNIALIAYMALIFLGIVAVVVIASFPFCDMARRRSFLSINSSSI